MAKQRQSVNKRQREYLKRQRELDKAEKAAQKRTRRHEQGDSSSAPPTDNMAAPRAAYEDSASAGE